MIRDDIKKLFASFSISEMIYAVTKVVAQYQFLQINIEAYEASIISSIIAWAVFFVAINTVAKVVKLFKNQ